MLTEEQAKLETRQQRSSRRGRRASSKARSKHWMARGRAARKHYSCTRLHAHRCRASYMTGSKSSTTLNNMSLPLCVHAQLLDHCCQTERMRQAHRQYLIGLAIAGTCRTLNSNRLLVPVLKFSRIISPAALTYSPPLLIASNSSIDNISPTRAPGTTLANLLKPTCISSNEIDLLSSRSITSKRCVSL